jgi:uncharacterized protein YdaU (DUF1376 family)
MFSYQHHIGDFIRDTSALSDSDAIAYLKLIWMYYDTELPLPAEPKLLAFKIGSTADSVQLILDAYFQLDNNLYHHKRCDAEIAAYKARSVIAKEKANKRWSNAPAMPQHTGSNAPDMKNDANREPITENQIKDIASTRGTRLATDWELSEEQKQFCKQERPDLDPIKVSDGFRDYWIAVAGAKGVKKDWDATWRNWVRNQKYQNPAYFPQNNVPEWKLRIK